MKKVLFIAGFPPPASGQLIMQKKMYDLFRGEDKKLINLNFSNDSKEFSKTSFKKIIKLVLIVLRITVEGIFFKNKTDRVYYSLSGPKRSALVKDMLIGIPLSLFLKRKLILQVHAGGYNEHFVESKFLFRCVQQLYANVSQLLCLTEYQKKELEFLHAKKSTIVYNFCEDRGMSENGLFDNKSENSLRLLSVGHINENKGILECIMLASLLMNNGINFKWKFIGSFKETTFEIRVRGMIANLNLKENVIIENETSNDLVLSEYHKADFLIFLSNGPEGQPVVLIEALMVAKAVIIAKNISGIDEYIRTGYNGFLVNDYTEALSILSNYDPQNLKLLRLNARRTYEEYFSAEKFSQKMSAIFKKPLAGM